MSTELRKAMTGGTPDAALVQQLMHTYGSLDGTIVTQYASAFAANLGSLGIDRAWHHLYEYGTCGVFAVVGVAGKSVEVGADGQPEVRDTLRIRYTFDERVNDGFYCARSLDLVRQAVERPEILVGASVVSA